jgi:demethylmenaquinone methyltransferase/2-methoxy-6-polyprenyl-1,4-benzoquinol methylase
LQLPADSLILDVAAGTGDFTRELAKQGYRAVSTDLSFGMLRAGSGMTNRVQSDAAHLPFATGSFDGLTCGYALRNFTELELAFREMARVTRPGGRISFLDVAEPSRGLLRWGFRFWFRGVVPLIGGLLSDRRAYQYLPRSTAYLPPVDDVRAMLVRAGFSGVNHRFVMGGLSQQYTATRAS